MDTVALLKEGRTFVPTRYVAEAFGATVSWDSAIRTVYVDMTKIIETGDTRNVVGFVVPKDIELMVVAPRNDINYEAIFTLDFLKRNIEKQKDDLEKILLQKFSNDTVKKIMDRVRSKTKPTDVIEEEYFYDSKTMQYIYLAKSWPVDDSTITILVYKKGIKLDR